MKYTGVRTAVGLIKDFLRDNKKCVVSCAAVFAVGMILGIFLTINASGGEFERVARSDIEFGAVKVFFTTSFALLLGYGVILLAAAAPSLVYVSLAVFGVAGYYFGRYMCLLVAVYGAAGIVNLVIIYIPFFLASLIFMIVAASKSVSAKGCGRMKSTAISLLKIYAFNIGFDFVLFVVIGAFAKVIVVGF